MISEVRQTIDERLLDQNRYFVLSLDNCASFTVPAYSPASCRRVKLVLDTTYNNFIFAGVFFLYFKHGCSVSLYSEAYEH